MDLGVIFTFIAFSRYFIDGSHWFDLQIIITADCYIVTSLKIL